MSRPRHDHVRYRELISARLDASLTPSEAVQLGEHLADCGRCRATEAAYRAQRQQLRSRPGRSMPPPRDLWARTSAALDREVVRQGGYAPPGRRRRQMLVGGAAVLSVTALGLSLSLAAMQLVPAASPSGTPAVAQVPARSTPFPVDGESLAFLGSGTEGLTVYRTRVDRVCPAAAIDCVDYESSATAVVKLPRTLQPSNLALSPNGGRLAIQGRHQGGEDVIAIVDMPADELARQPGRTGTGGNTMPADGNSSVSPSASASATTAPMLPTPLVDGPTATATPMASALPSASPTMKGPEPVTSENLPATPLPSEIPTEVVAILDEVRSVGAPAAWSPDGGALAFSAMPADLSRGPDVYIWRPGDARAQPLTDDHASYFASWAGTRVVVSRVASAHNGDDEPAREPMISTVVIDPVTGENRTVADGAGLWLPAVNPLSTNLIAWHGTLSRLANDVEPLSGALYLLDWTALDPFSGPVPAPSQVEPEDEQASPADDEALPHDTPAAAPSDAVEPADGSAPDQAAANGASPSDEPTEGQSDDPSAKLRMEPVEPSRNPARDPVRDWQIRWSSDGRVMAFWIADVPGSSWGQLSVLQLDPVTGQLNHDEPLLAASLARRAFSLGDDRVAWVTPADGQPQGTLRIRTWGPDGYGDLRLRTPPQGEEVPAS